MNALISQSSSKLLQKNLLQKAFRSQAMRSMTMISKESAEEYKKLVRFLIVILQILLLLRFIRGRLSHPITNMYLLELHETHGRNGPSH